MKLFDAVVKRIQEIMTEKQMTQYALAKKIAINESSLHCIFYKKQKDISTGRLHLICDGLGITIQEFYNSPLFNKENIEVD
jgi:DNA-binding Xre family transcriptional regulator